MFDLGHLLHQMPYLTGKEKHEHISPALASLHLCSLEFTIKFLSSLVNVCIGLTQVSVSIRLGYKDVTLKLWHNLPFQVRLPASITAYKPQLKTHHFSLACPPNAM